jgi:hypothetical protein
MLAIKHRPQFDVKTIEQHYSEKDGVDVKYVCTSDLIAEDVPVDIFYRETPHPEFGNRYFGLYLDRVRDHLMITNADVIEQKDFGVIAVDGEYHYSQSRHDYNAVTEDCAIDGGRQYVRVIGKSVTDQFTILRIKNGDFVQLYPASMVE